MTNARITLLFTATLAAFWFTAIAMERIHGIRALGDEKRGGAGDPDDALPKGAIQRITVKFGETRYNEKGGVIAVDWSPNGKMVACRCSDNTARIYAIPDGKEVLQVRHSPLMDANQDNCYIGVAPLLFSPDGKTLATSLPSSTVVKLWNTSSGELLHEFTNPRRYPSCIAFSPDGRMIAITCPEGIRLWDVRKGQLVRTFDSHEAEKAPERIESRCLFALDGRTLITAAHFPGIRFWDWHAGGEELGQIPGKELCNTSLDVSRDGQTLALCTGHNVQKVAIYELATRCLVNELEGSRGNMPCAKFSSDGVTLATSDSHDNRVLLWNFYTGAVDSHKGHKRAVYEVAFSPDGGKLVSASADGTLLFWKVPEVKIGNTNMPLEDWKLQWDWLLGDNAKLAYWAIWKLREAGDLSVVRIKERIKPVPEIDGEAVKKLIVDLDASDFHKRRSAFIELSRLGEQVKPMLRKALEGKPSAEIRKHVRTLLGKWRFPTYSGEPLRAIRAIQVLERIGTPKAREVLAEIAKGAQGAHLTRLAKGAVERLDRRAASK